MPGPRVYVSACAGELRTVRDRVAEKLEAFGFEGVWVDFGVGDDWQDHAAEVHRQMLGCRGLLLLLGNMYGADADPALTGKDGRCSWNQWEYLEAQRKGLPTWVIEAGRAVTRDLSPGDEGVDWEREDELAPLRQAFRERPEVRYCPLARDDRHLLELVPDPRTAPAVPVRHVSSASPGPKAKLTIRVVSALVSLAAGVTAVISWQTDGRLKKLFSREKEDPEERRPQLIEVDPAQVENRLAAWLAAKHSAELESAKKLPDKAEQERQSALAVERVAYRRDRLALIMERMYDDGRQGRQFSANVDLGAAIVNGGLEAGLTFLQQARPRLLAAAKRDEGLAVRRARLTPLLWAVDLQFLKGDISAARAASEELAGMDAEWPDLKAALAYLEYAASCDAFATGDAAAAAGLAEKAAAVAGTAAPEGQAGEPLRMVQQMIQRQAAAARRGGSRSPDGTGP